MAEALVRTFLGNVGIGTNDPGSYSLDVNGSASLGSIVASGLTVGSVTNAHVPYGLILIWSDSVASIPSGWALCNGTNGTPDMRDKYVVGAGSTYTAPNDTGGANQVTLTETNLPAHTHGYTTTIENVGHNHALTDPGHAHATNATDYGGRIFGTTCQAGQFYTQHGFNSQAATLGLTQNANSSNHTHNFTSGYSGSATPSAINLRPKYHALCFIMKT